MLYELVMLAVGLVLTIGTGFFVAAEFALVNLDRADLEARAQRCEPGLSRTIAALRITSTHLSSAQLGITLTTLIAGYAFEPAISHLLRDPLLATGLPEPAVTPIAAVVAIAIATLVSMVLGELVPKNLALTLPIATAKVVVPFQAAFTAVFRPAVALLNGSANGILRAMGITPKEELSGARSAEELSSLVRRSATAGLLEQDTATLLDRTLRFSVHTAADVMTPRPRLVAVARDAPARAVIDTARRTGLSRFPVVDDDLDEIIGVVHIKRAVAVPRERREQVMAGQIAEEVLRVPETMHLDGLLAELRGRGYQLAVVMDEYGGTAGVATLEDLVEEIVGEVSDEHDRATLGVVRGRNGVSFPGRLRPDEVRERIDLTIPENGAYETVAGYVMSELGRIPSVGDEVAVDGGVLRVERMDGRRVDRVRFLGEIASAAERDAGGERP